MLLEKDKSPGREKTHSQTKKRHLALLSKELSTHITAASLVVLPVIPHQKYSGKKRGDNGNHKQKFKFAAAQKAHRIVKQIDDIHNQKDQRSNQADMRNDAF